MENLYESFTRMIETVVENEENISVWGECEYGNFAYTFIPYEYNLQGKIYLEGEGCILNIDDISEMELSYDEFEDQFEIVVPGCRFYIGI